MPGVYVRSSFSSMVGGLGNLGIYLNLIVVTRSNPFMFELSSHPSCKGDPEEQVLYDHDTASAMEILEDYFTGVP